MKEVTLGDIADIAGCSKNTVSLALRGSDRISAKRREDIEEIALSLGYVPHLSARHLSGKRSGYVGVYTKTLHDAVRSTLINNILTGFRDTGLHPILGLGDSPDQKWEQSSWIQSFRAMRAEAIALVGEVRDFELTPSRQSTPYVLIHCQPDESLPYDYVGLDRSEASNLGRQHFFATGRRNLVIFGDSSSPFCEITRSEKTIPALDPKQFKITARNLVVSNLEEMSKTCLSYYLKHRGKFDAALFQDSGVAAGFINLAFEAGIPIPDEIAVVGYDCYPQAHLLKVSLSTIEQPLDELSQRAIELILKRVHRPDAPLTHEVLPHRLFRRGSS
jgi:DNA-binding LacI/PurR family transcriptional regulator